MTRISVKADLPQLPPDIKPDDLKWPSWRSKVRVLRTLSFYYVPQFGWCIATLLIRNPGRSRSGDAVTARTYATRISDGALVRVGLGPHVSHRIEVCVTDKNLARLQKYVDLYLKGETDAGNCRDRISTRRAQGTLRRRWAL